MGYPHKVEGQGTIIQKSKPDPFHNIYYFSAFIEIEIVALCFTRKSLADIEGIFGPSFSNQGFYSAAVELFECLKTLCSFYPVLLGLVQNRIAFSGTRSGATNETSPCQGVP